MVGITKIHEEDSDAEKSSLDQRQFWLPIDMRLLSLDSFGKDEFEKGDLISINSRSHYKSHVQILFQCGDPTEVSVHRQQFAFIILNNHFILLKDILYCENYGPST